LPDFKAEYSFTRSSSSNALTCLMIPSSSGSSVGGAGADTWGAGVDIGVAGVDIGVAGVDIGVAGVDITCAACAVEGAGGDAEEEDGEERYGRRRGSILRHKFGFIHVVFSLNHLESVL
jgi:hypothetical protein